MSATTDLDNDRSPTATAHRPGQRVVARAVRFVCPRCGGDRDGLHVDGLAAGWVQCNDCSYRCDPGVLEIPTDAVLAEWHAHAVRHSQAALRCADGSPSCAYLASVWCRRLAPELTLWGKTSLLDSITRPIAGALSAEQRAVVVQLGVALRMPPATINQVLDTP